MANKAPLKKTNDRISNIQYEQVYFIDTFYDIFHELVVKKCN